MKSITVDFSELKHEDFSSHSIYYQKIVRTDINAQIIICVIKEHLGFTVWSLPSMDGVFMEPILRGYFSNREKAIRRAIAIEDEGITLD